MKHINLFETFNETELKHKPIMLTEGTVQDEYNEMREELHSKTKPLKDEMQKHYKEINKIQEKIKKIEDSYKAKDEALRKKAVEQEPNSGFLTKHDKKRFDPQFVKRSAELRDKIIEIIIKNNKKLDDDGLYTEIQQLLKGEELMMDDTSKIYDAVNKAGLYIHGM